MDMMNTNKKGQTSGEFFLVFIALLLLYTGMLMLYNNWVEGLRFTKAKLEANQAGERIAFATNFVLLAGDGTSYNTYMNAPGSNITVTKNIVDVNSTRSAVAQVEMLTNNTNYTVIRNSGNISIRNNGGRIDFR